jgi:hypothetical protein
VRFFVGETSLSDTEDLFHHIVASEKSLSLLGGDTDLKMPNMDVYIH